MILNVQYFFFYEEQRVESLGDHLPALQQLKLNNSHLPCLRDLGTKLSKLQVPHIFSIDREPQDHNAEADKQIIYIRY